MTLHKLKTRNFSIQTDALTHTLCLAIALGGVILAARPVIAENFPLEEEIFLAQTGGPIVPFGGTASPYSSPLPSAGQPSTVQKPAPLPPIPSGTRKNTVPKIDGCMVFPENNAWNEDVSMLPVHPNSAAYINSIGAAGRLHPDFGKNSDYGIPFITVPAGQKKMPVTFTAYPEESDPGPYPIPLNAPIEAGSDHHVIAVDTGNCMLYELYRAERRPDGWAAESGAKFDLRSNQLRPAGWTSADAAGLPIFPGLVRYEEVASGAIRHALRFTVKRSQRAYILPATHWASRHTDANLPPMGLRLRLRQDYDISRFTGQSRIILEALKRYGMILADNGSNWFISGTPDPRWNDGDLRQLKTVPGSAFEAVDTGPIVRP